MGARGAPVFAAALDLEAVLAEAVEGRLEFRYDHSQVAAGRDRRLLLRHQVDLGALALEPNELGQRRRWLDPLEPKQGEELDRALDLRWGDLDADVMEHQNKSEARAPANPIATARAIAPVVRRTTRA